MPRYTNIPEGAPEPPPNATFGSRHRIRQESGEPEAPRRRRQTTPTVETPPRILRRASMRVGDEEFGFAPDERD